MTSPSLAIFPPSSIEEFLALVAEMPDSHFQALCEDVKECGFDLHEERCKRLAERLDLNAEIVALLLNALGFIYSRVRRINPPDPRDVFADFVSSFDDPAFGDDERERLLNRLTALVSPSDEVDLTRKLRRLRAGFLNNATGFASFVDVRPDFDADNTRIRGFVPMVQFRVSTDSDNPGEQEFVFQVDDIGLDALRKALEAAEKKMSTLRAANMLAAPLYRRGWMKDA